MILTFQSNLHGQCGTTATMLAVAFGLKREYPEKRIVLVHSQSGCTDLEKIFKESSIRLDNDMGFSSLICQFKARELTLDDINGAAIKLANGLYLLPSDSNRGADIELDRIVSGIIVNSLPKFFDIVLVDVGAGRGSMFDNTALKLLRDSADINFLVCSQNPATQEKPNFENYKVIVGNYDPKRKNNSSVITGCFGVVPYCTEYADAITEKKVTAFFSSFNGIYKGDKKKGLFNKKAEDDVVYFCDSVNDIAQKIGKTLNKRR